MSGKYLGVVLARGGSKRLPRKNILPLGGIPLIGHTLQAGIASQLDKLVVSSDDAEILDIAKHYGAETLKRPAELASDTASSIDAIVHTLESFSTYEYVVLLQATSPFREANHINEALALLQSKGADGIISVCEVEHSPLWTNTLDESLNMQGFLQKELRNKRGQDLQSYYRLNGAIYIAKVEKLLQEKTFFLQENIFAYVMDRQSSIDIDQMLDFRMAEVLLEERGRVDGTV